MRDLVERIRARFEWRRNVRRLEISRSGKWYIALTIALGVTALASGNNAIYLMESLLLAGLILSGVLSERQVSAVRIEFRRLQARAGEPTEDWIIVRNESKKTLFCLEVGEWNRARFQSLAFFAKIRAGETVRARSSQIVARRGIYRWDGFAIATHYPFGFARKIKVVKIPGERVVWPAPIGIRRRRDTEPTGERGARNREMDVVDGEIRKYDWTDDARLILANQSIRGAGAMVRNRRPVLKEPEVQLDLRVVGGEPFEASVRTASAVFYRSETADLVLVHAKGRKKVTGKQAALTALALAVPEGRP
jgi:uncharacterized protein (DUF58 family)